MAVFRSFYEKKTTQVYLNPMVGFDKNRTLDVEIKMGGEYLFSHYKTVSSLQMYYFSFTSYHF